MNEEKNRINHKLPNPHSFLQHPSLCPLLVYYLLNYVVEDSNIPQTLKTEIFHSRLKKIPQYPTRNLSLPKSDASSLKSGHIAQELNKAQPGATANEQASPKERSDSNADDGACAQMVGGAGSSVEFRGRIRSGAG